MGGNVAIGPIGTRDPVLAGLKEDRRITAAEMCTSVWFARCLGPGTLCTESKRAAFNHCQSVRTRHRYGVFDGHGFSSSRAISLHLLLFFGGAPASLRSPVFHQPSSTYTHPSTTWGSLCPWSLATWQPFDHSSMRDSSRFLWLLVSGPGYYWYASPILVG